MLDQRQLTLSIVFFAQVVDMAAVVEVIAVLEKFPVSKDLLEVTVSLHQIHMIFLCTESLIGYILGNNCHF